MIETPEAQTAAPAEDEARPEAQDLANWAVQLLRRLPRPVDQRQIAGFLAVCRAHPSVSAALDYVARKESQAQRGDQRVEQQFWSQARERLTALDETPDAARNDGKTAGTALQAFAQHLAAENLLRQALTADGNRPPPGRRGGPARGTAQHTGEARD